MTALTNDQRRELEHIAVVTNRGGWTYRLNGKLTTALAKAGYIVARVDYIGVEETYSRYRITPAGIAALADGEPSTVRAWCDTCGAVTVHHCLYDHATGERFECAGCAERIAS